MEVDKLSFGDLHIEGASRAGVETWLRVRPPGLAFDVGRGPLELTGAGDLFLTHGHLDHALGVPFLLSHRRAQGFPATTIYAPAAIAEALTGFVTAAAALAGEAYEFRIEPLQVGDRVTVGANLTVEAFATDHVGPSLGYHLLRSTRRLRSELRGRSGSELAELRRRGSEIDLSETEIWMSFCGDTGPGVFDLEPRILESPVLVIECTLYDPDTRERARRFRHLHLEDLVARAGSFRNRHLVLHHVSRRYDRSDVERMIRDRLELAETQVHLFGC